MGIMLSFIKNFSYAIAVYVGFNPGMLEFIGNLPNTEDVIGVILAFMMVVDSLLGIGKALKLKRKFSFKVLGWGIVMKISLLLIPLMVALIAKATGFDFSTLVVVTLNILIISEGVSWVTNILSIRTGKEVKNNDYVTILLQKIKLYLSRMIEKGLELIKIEQK
jgi:hypothetical protein